MDEPLPHPPSSLARPPPPGHLIPYATPAGVLRTDRGRPGLLTAAGVMDIVVALLSLLASAVGATIWLSAYRGSVPPPSPLPLPPLPPPHVAPYAGECVGPRGLPQSQREVIDAYLAEPALPPDRRAMLDRLLADAGRDAFPGGAVDRATVTATGLRLVPPTTQPDSVVGATTTVLVTNHARIELTNTTATLLPRGSSAGPRVRGNAFIDADRPPAWSSLAVSAMLDNEYRASHGGMTSFQATVLRDAIRDYLAPPTRAADFTLPPLSIPPGGPDAEPNLRVSVGGQQLWLLPNGWVVDARRFPQRLDPLTGRPFPPVSTFRPVLPGSPTFMLGLGAEAVVSAAFALLLLVAGVRTLRDRPAAALHVYYVPGKLLLAVVCLCVSWAFIESVRGAARTPTSGPAFTPSLRGFDVGRGLLGTWFSFCLQISYPVALALAFRAATVRDYLAARGQRWWLVGPGGRAGARRLLATPLGRLLLWSCGAAAVVAAIAHGAIVSHGRAGASSTIALRWNWAGLIAGCVVAFGCALLLGWSRGAKGGVVTALLLALITTLSPSPVRADPPPRAGPTSRVWAPPPYYQKPTPVPELIERFKRSRDAYERFTIASYMAQQGEEGAIALFNLVPDAAPELQHTMLAWASGIYFQKPSEAMRRASVRALPALVAEVLGSDSVMDSAYASRASEALARMGYRPELLADMPKLVLKLRLSSSQQVAALLPTDPADRRQILEGLRKLMKEKPDLAGRPMVGALEAFGEMGVPLQAEIAVRSPELRAEILPRIMSEKGNSLGEVRKPSDLERLARLPEVVALAKAEMARFAATHNADNVAPLAAAVRILLLAGPEGKGLVIDQCLEDSFYGDRDGLLKGLPYANGLQQFIDGARGQDPRHVASRAVIRKLLHVLNERPREAAGEQIISMFRDAVAADDRVAITMTSRLIAATDLREQAGPATQALADLWQSELPPAPAPRPVVWELPPPNDTPPATKPAAAALAWGATGVGAGLMAFIGLVFVFAGAKAATPGGVAGAAAEVGKELS